jgi:hypothetical protein
MIFRHDRSIDFHMLSNQSQDLRLVTGEDPMDCLDGDKQAYRDLTDCLFHPAKTGVLEGQKVDHFEMSQPWNFLNEREKST